MGSLPTDEDTLFMYEAPDEYSREIDDRIRNCSIARDLRSRPDFRESRPHLKIPEAVRAHNLTGGTLAGPGMIVVPPYIWTEKEGKELVSIFYVGNNVSGHPGIVHGGLLATMLDEGLARCCFPAIPNKVGVTATLQISYQKPTETEQYLVLKATTTKVEGRKAFVEGHIETLPEDGEEPQVLVSANALFIEPKHAAVSGTNARDLRVLLTMLFFPRCLRACTKSLDELCPTDMHGKEFVGYRIKLTSEICFPFRYCDTRRAPFCAHRQSTSSYVSGYLHNGRFAFGDQSAGLSSPLLPTLCQLLIAVL